MSAKVKPRARRMWANYYADGTLGIYGKRATAEYFRGFLAGPIVPVAVIPLDDVPALLTRFCDATHESSAKTYRGSMQDALISLGVLPKRKGGRK
jgi:hypothetical protein